MAVQIGASPDSGFDDPIGMLIDCHRRIEHFLHILCVVVERATARALSVEETAAVEAALHYFRVGGRRHTADEEESLFPRIKERSVLDELEALEQDHETALRLHEEVEAAYTRWIRSGSIRTEEHLRLSTLTARLKRLYVEHVRIEEESVFPHAADTFNLETLHAMGEEFRKRRG